jgi:transcriptional regulator with XRE-family HTH domain
MARTQLPPRVFTVLQAKRQEKGWSQERLGLHPDVRIAQDFISRIERGEGLPTPAQAERIAKALGIPVETLLQPALPVAPDAPVER